MNKYECIKEEDFLRTVGLSRSDFNLILLELELQIEKIKGNNPIKKGGESQ